MLKIRLLQAVVLGCAVTSVTTGQLWSQDQGAMSLRSGRSPANETRVDALVAAKVAMEKGRAFLLGQQQPDGGWQTKGQEQMPAITALVLGNLVSDPRYKSNAAVDRGYDKLLTYQLEDGGIYKSGLAVYNTAICISALSKSGRPDFEPRIAKAVNYLKSLQWTDTIEGMPKGEKITGSTDPRYGGWGYGSKGRPDGSNTGMALEALKDAGVKSDDPVFQRAVQFLSRNQNNSETNDQPFAGNDGGFIYSSAFGGESFAGTYTDGGTTRFYSYGSMTYAGVKSMLYAGLSANDPRVKSALRWVQQHWTVDENPGMAAGGKELATHSLYYYLRTMGKALHAVGQPTVTDSSGVAHDWRIELANKLVALQNPDGSWKGEKRWMEDNSVLATSYALTALEAAVDSLEHDRPSK
jgi:squalene-hopene/tetraprenyl-beta-curcumene cyclase